MQKSNNHHSHKRHMSYPHHLDLDAQRYVVSNYRKQQHDAWIQQHNAMTKFDHNGSKARAEILVCEAWRLEKLHLTHQHKHAKALLRKQEATVNSPRKVHCEREDSCACLEAPIFRQLLPKYRAMNLLLHRFQADRLESAVDSLRRTYSCDDDMMQDLLDRYGPEGTDVDPQLWLRSIEERQANIDNKWREIGREVKNEMSDADRFQTVIRNLSIMRIFLEGSQASRYGCDTSERMRRDAVHTSVLDKLEMNGTLFLHE